LQTYVRIAKNRNDNDGSPRLMYDRLPLVCKLTQRKENNLLNLFIYLQILTS